MKTKNKFIITILIFTLSSFILLIESKDVLANTLTIQPSNIDAYISEGAPNTNYGTTEYLIVYPGGGIDRSLLKFDFTSLPTGATITTATLNLYYYAATGNPTGRTVWAYELTTTGWTEAGVTWNKYDGTNAWSAAGGDYTTTNGASLVCPASYGWMSWNVLALAQHFQSTHGEVAHFLMKDGTEDGAGAGPDFSSNNYGTSSLRPKLIITYTAPPPTATVSRPDNLALFNTSITFECNTTDNNQLYNVSLIANWTGSWAVNETTIINGTSNSTIFNVRVPNGKYSWSAYACNIYSTCGYASENRTVLFDNINPNINITLPLNITYAIPPTKISYIASDTNLQSCWYSLDKGTTNTTITCGNNVTGLSSNVGSNTWTVYVNDSASNTNKSVVTFTYTQANNFIIQNSTNENQTYFIINTIGNVGFGTSGPTSKLTILGDMNILNSLSANSTDINISTGSYTIEKSGYKYKIYIDNGGNLIII